MNKIVYVVLKGFYDNIFVDRVFIDKEKATFYVENNKQYQIIANSHKWDSQFKKQVENGMHPLGMEIVEAMLDDSITV